MQKNNRELANIKMELECSNMIFEDYEKKNNYRKLPLTELTTLGTAAASMLPFFRTVTSSIDPGILATSGGPGLYMASFPNGLNGTLATAKDGSGFIGTILNNGIKGQSRFNPVSPDTLKTIGVQPIDPMTFGLAIALNQISSKLDQIQETTQSILDFLEKDKKAEAKANLDTLFRITKELPFNTENNEFITSKLTTIQEIERIAQANIIFYRENIKQESNSKDLIHLQFQTNAKLKKLQDFFNMYNMSIYTASFAKFIEVILLKNFDENYINTIIKTIKNNSLEYRKTYTDCYNLIENQAKQSVENIALGGLSFVTKQTGNVLGSIPLLNKGPIDDFLLDTSDSLSKEKQKINTNTLKQITDKSFSNTRVFVSNLEAIKNTYNKPLDLLFDKENIYLPQ